jgi:hypothetical protein
MRDSAKKYEDYEEIKRELEIMKVRRMSCGNGLFHMSFVPLD